MLIEDKNENSIRHFVNSAMRRMLRSPNERFVVILNDESFRCVPITEIEAQLLNLNFTRRIVGIYDYKCPEDWLESDCAHYAKRTWVSE